MNTFALFLCFVTAIVLSFTFLYVDMAAGSLNIFKQFFLETVSR